MPTFSKFLNGFRGCQQVLDSDGYIYSSKEYDDTVLSSAWRCQKNKSLKCPAMCYLALTDNTLSLGSKPHNHDSDLATPQRLELLTTLKRKAAEQPLSATQNLISEVLADASTEVNQTLPNMESLGKVVQRARASASGSAQHTESKTSLEFVLPPSCTSTTTYNMQSANSLSPPEKPIFIRGRTVGSINLVLQGFRYGKDGKPTKDGRQAWRCVLRKYKCPGRLYTTGDSVCDSPKPHIHPANFTNCEVKTIYSRAKDLRICSNNPPAQILNSDEIILKESYGDAPPAKRARQITKDRRLAHLVEVYDDQDLVSHLDMLRNVMAEE